MQQRENSDQLIKQYWDYFFRDNFNEAYRCTDELVVCTEDKELGLELKARMMLKQGLYEDANDIAKQLKNESALKLFLHFIVSGDYESVINKFGDDIDGLIFKAQCITITRIYFGEDAIPEDPDLLLEKVFNKLVDDKEYDRAILTYAQFIELLFREQELGKDILIPIATEQLDNLLELSKKAKYDSTKAKVFLLKAKILKDKESAEDAEILFGKDNNQNGLAEVYSFYAVDCEEDEYFQKAIDIFTNLNNLNAQGYLYESLASKSLVQGSIQEACQYFEQAEKILSQAGIFEKIGLEIQKLSLHAVKGEFKVLKEKSRLFLDSHNHVPMLFQAQAYQILATSMLYTNTDFELGEEYIKRACSIFKDLKKFNQLLNAKNIQFQFVNLSDDLDDIVTLGDEIIQIANRLERYDEKAAKYVDLAFAIIKVHADSGNLEKDQLDVASDYFQKAIDIHKAQDNVTGEADVFQAMGNMFANVGKLEESFKCLAKAKELYVQEKALLQGSITCILIGLLVGDEAIVSEATYPIVTDNFETALAYFSKESLRDLTWKTCFYLAELNERMYLKKKIDVYQERAKKYYLEMYDAAQKYEVDSESNEISIGSTTLDEAFNKAHGFFKLMNDPTNAQKFFRNHN